MNAFEKLCDKIDIEMSDFKSQYEELSPLEVYNDSYKINFFESFKNMLCNDYIDNDVNANLIAWLSEKNNPIDFLYDAYIGSDVEMSYDWDDMLDWMAGVYLEEKEHDKQDFCNKIGSLGLKDVPSVNDDYFDKFDYYCHISNEPIVFSSHVPIRFDKDLDKEFGAFFKEKLLVKSCDYGCDTYPDGIKKAVGDGNVYTKPGIVQTYQQRVWDFIESVEEMFDCNCHFYEDVNGFEFAFEFGSGDRKGCYALAAGNNGQEYSECLYLTKPELIRDPQIANIIISIDKALYALLEGYNLRLKMPENVLSNENSLDDKADFLISFFDAQLINMSIDVKDGHLFAMDDEGNDWKDAEIYDFALNECLCFIKDGSLASGLAAAEPYVERLKADAKEFGVDITSFVTEKNRTLDIAIKQAKDCVVDKKDTKTLNNEYER